MNSVIEKLMPAQNLKECAICSRHFASERIRAHEAICQKSHNIARKSFDISKQRIRGTEAEKFAKAGNKSECFAPFQKDRPCGLSTNWRRKHEEFIKKVRDAKELFNGKNKANDLPFSPSVNDTDYVQCQHCLRLFNQISAGRHIATCTSKMCRPKSKSNLTGNSIPTTSKTSFANK